MIRHIKSKCITIIILMLTMLSSGCAERGNKMNLFDFIDKTRNEYMLGYKHFIDQVPVRTVVKNINEQRAWYKSESFPLSDGVVVEGIDIRVSKGEDIPVVIKVNVVGECITVSKIKELYPDLKVSSTPRSDAPGEMTYYKTTADKNNIILFFGFANALPDCLGGIVIREKEDDE